MTVLLCRLQAAGCGSAAANGPEALQGVVEHDEVLLAFEVGGRLLALEVDRGQHVEVGAALGRLDDSLERPAREVRAAEQRAAQAQLALLRAGARGEEVRGAAAELRAAESGEDLLEQRLARQRALVARGVSPSAPVEDLERELERAHAQRQAIEQRLTVVRRGARSEEVAAAEARVAAATSALAAADARLSRYVLVAPRAGTVLDLHYQAGEVVAPGAPVVTIADTAHPFVDVFVPQGRVGGLRVGTPASVRVDAEPRPMAGRIENVGRRTEFTPRFLFSERERPNLVVRVRVRVEDPEERLHAGVPAFVSPGR